MMRKNTTDVKKSKSTVQKPARRHPLATVALIAIGLLATGGAYALATVPADAGSAAVSAELIADGEKLFAANCASCHGLNLEGTVDAPTLIGVGAASVDFQVGTGRMPMAMSGPQAQVKPVQFTEEQISALAAYVASVSPGPAIPEDQYTDGTTYGENGLAQGGELFRTNCAMCHNVAAAGGALTEGKYAPSLIGVDGTYIYEAMVTGPQNMPVFNDDNITPEEKANLIAYLKFLETEPAVGGYSLGSLGPVSEGLFIWIFGLGAIVGITIWLTSKSN